jgi:hypothetical protein
MIPVKGGDGGRFAEGGGRTRPEGEKEHKLLNAYRPLPSSPSSEAPPWSGATNE